MATMYIGDRKITKCNNCPAYQWSGESISQGNHGCACEFGAFSSDYSENKAIPKNCPISSLNNLEMVRKDLEKENCEDCYYKDINDDPNKYCYLHKEMVINCENKNH